MVVLMLTPAFISTLKPPWLLAIGVVEGFETADEVEFEGVGEVEDLKVADKVEDFGATEDVEVDGVGEELVIVVVAQYLSYHVLITWTSDAAVQEPTPHNCVKPASPAWSNGLSLGSVQKQVWLVAGIIGGVHLPWTS